MYLKALVLGSSIVIISFSISYACKSLFHCIGSNPQVANDLRMLGLVAISMLEAMALLMAAINVAMPDFYFLSLPIALISMAMSKLSLSLFTSICLNPKSNSVLKTLGLITLSMVEVLAVLVFILPLIG